MTVFGEYYTVTIGHRIVIIIISSEATLYNIHLATIVRYVLNLEYNCPGTKLLLVLVNKYFCDDLFITRIHSSIEWSVLATLRRWYFLLVILLYYHSPCSILLSYNWLPTYIMFTNIIYNKTYKYWYADYWWPSFVIL